MKQSGRTSGVVARSRAADPAHAVRLLSEVRGRCAELRDMARAGRLEHFTIDPGKIDAAAVRVVKSVRHEYPDLKIPQHSCWRHFSAGGIERWDFIREEAAFDTSPDLARSAIDLAVLTVLMTAGPGATWRYAEDDSELVFARSEGLSLATLQMFRMGLFSGASNPYQVDPEGLAGITEEVLAQYFQVSDKNPLSGIREKKALLDRLAATLDGNKGTFGLKNSRPGHLFDVITARGRKRQVRAAEVFAQLIEVFAPLWPEGVHLAGKNMGDVGRHSKLVRADKSSGYVPLHRLAQWMTYCLIEPFEWGGIEITDLDDMTGLAELRNGGLFVDAGVLMPRDAEAFSKRWLPDDEFIVEWRALTVALLDDIRPLVADYLGKKTDDLTLSRLMQGGSWQAGRALSLEKRPDGSPIFSIAGSGILF